MVLQGHVVLHAQAIVSRISQALGLLKPEHHLESEASCKGLAELRCHVAPYDHCSTASQPYRAAQHVLHHKLVPHTLWDA